VFLPIRTLKSMWRNPLRFLAVLAAIGLAVAGIRAVVVEHTFRHHLKEARIATSQWHNYTAIRHLVSCRSIRPEHPEVLLLASRVARRLGEMKEAEALLDAYSQEHGETDELVFERLLYRATNGDTDSTAVALQARLRGGGEVAQLIWEAQLFGLVQQFRFAEARAVMTAWLAARPDDPVAHYFDGKLKVEEGGTEQAIAAFRRALELDPAQEQARMQLATLLVARRRGEEAIEELQPLRQQLPDHAEVQVLWVRALALVGRAAEARQVLDDCLRLHPTYAPALVERGSFAILEGDEAGAIDYLTQALQREPANLTARNQLALALSRMGRHADAAKEYEAIKQLTADSDRITELVRGALQKDPNNAEIYREIGIIALRSGDVPAALRWFHSGLRVDSNHLPTHRTLAAVYQELDNPILAAKHRALAQRLSTQQGK
jgi:tetratricopeptide (TPR) repeat protein